MITDQCSRHSFWLNCEFKYQCKESLLKTLVNMSKLNWCQKLAFILCCSMLQIGRYHRYTMHQNDPRMRHTLAPWKMYVGTDRPHLVSHRTLQCKLLMHITAVACGSGACGVNSAVILHEHRIQMWTLQCWHLDALYFRHHYPDIHMDTINSDHRWRCWSLKKTKPILFRFVEQHSHLFNQLLTYTMILLNDFTISKTFKVPFISGPVLCSETW